MRSRKNSRDDAADSGDLESWITDLAGGETTVRRLRERLDATGQLPRVGCAVCERSAEAGSGHEGHDPSRLTA